MGFGSLFIIIWVRYKYQRICSTIFPASSPYLPKRIPDHAQLLLVLFSIFCLFNLLLLAVLPLLLLVAIFRVINFQEGIYKVYVSCRKSHKAKTKKQYVNDELSAVEIEFTN